MTAIGTEIIADLEVTLDSAAESVPEVEAVDAETTEVDQTLDQELAETESRTGSQGKGAAAEADRDALVKDLQDQGIKCNPDKITRIERGADGKIKFLEEGNSRAGLKHIVDRHASDFANKGVPAEDIPDVTIKAVTEGEQVGMQGSRPIYEITYQGRPLKVAVTTGDNGFIVGANPVA